MTHSIAPWTLAEANACIPVKSADGRTVTSVRYGNTDLDDALLIAAAPDLLAALRAFVEQATKLSGHPAQYDPYVGALVQARAAIAKATG